MVRDLKSLCPWINRHILNYSFEKFTSAQKKHRSTPSSEENNTNLGGRPVVTTNKEKHDLKIRTRECLDAAATEFHEKRNIAKRDGKYVKKGCLDDIIREHKIKFGLSENIKIDKEAIRNNHF